MDHSFPKELRLTHKKDIDHLFEKGQRLKSHPFVILYEDITPKRGIPFKLLISVPKRNFKRAVDRNYLKRCIREIVRRNKELLTKGDDKTLCIAILYSFKTKLEFSRLEEGLLNGLKKIHS
ncbi:MAG: ribonuclease P protein component [Crocinitomicaceae bacterium]|jgi:ribonuclease P protein component|tara:strand:+ start:3336 stop:3698 length:363 start_codon:yes stop_codon:yes gene_type:complete